MSAHAHAGHSSAAFPETATIKVISHSMLFYWWPLWAVGFLMAVLTYLDGSRMVVVPEGTKIKAVGDEAKDDTYALTLSRKPTESLREAASADLVTTARMADHRDYGIVYALVLLLVIFIANVPMRGLWSVFVLMLIVLLIVGFAALGLWGLIFDAVAKLRIYISAEGYLFISAVLFLFWVVVFFLYDQRRFMIFTPGQFIVHQEVGDLRQVFDTTNVTVEKRRSDLFRHWILGFGSGDLIVQTPGMQGAQMVLPNVLFAAWKVQQIADLMKTRPIVRE